MEAEKKPEYVETEEQRKERLSRPVGSMDYVIVQQACPDMPRDLLLQMLFGNR